MLPAPSSCMAREQVFVIERSTIAWTQVDAGASPEPSSGRHGARDIHRARPGQWPPVALVVGGGDCTVKVRAAGVVPPNRHRPAVREPAAIEQLPPQPAPWDAIVQDRPAFVGSLRQDDAMGVAVAGVVHRHREPDRTADVHLRGIRRLHDLMSAGLMLASPSSPRHPGGRLVVDVAGVGRDPVVRAGRGRGEVTRFVVLPLPSTLTVSVNTGSPEQSGVSLGPYRLNVIVPPGL